LFYRGSFYAEPDLVFFMKRRVNRKLENFIPFSVIVIEYKSNGEERLIEKGETQLEKSVNYYNKIIKISAEGKLIIGNSYLILKNYLPF